MAPQPPSSYVSSETKSYPWLSLSCTTTLFSVPPGPHYVSTLPRLEQGPSLLSWPNATGFSLIPTPPSSPHHSAISNMTREICSFFFFQNIKLIWLIGKDPDAGEDWGQEEKEVTENEMVGWHHQISEHEFEQTPGDSEGQESLACCSPWDHRVRHDSATQQAQHR